MTPTKTKAKYSINMLDTRAKDPTHALFGIGLDGEPVSFKISEGPHWIIAGQTGSGKSVFLNQILVSMISHAVPEELQLFWIDPKKVEASAYEGLPFCPIDPIIDMNDAYGFIAYLTWLMDERYEVFAKVKAKKIDDYNRMVYEQPDMIKEKLGTDTAETFPYIVLIVDEYADLTDTNREVEGLLVRIGQKARAAGIHVIIATQRPSADVVTPRLKANFPSRVGLKTADGVNSGIIVDEPGCELLAGYGDGLIKLGSGSTELIRVQGPFITDDEIAKIFKYIREHYTRPKFEDYKQKVVDLELCEWADEYTDDVPWEDRHVVQKRRSRFM